MTPQEVIQSFMDKLTNHGLSSSDSVSTQMLDAAIKASSKYGGIQDAIDAMKSDQIVAERKAVEEVLGSEYKGKTISDIDSSILSAEAKTYDTDNIGNAYLNQWNDNRTTIERLIKERKAIIFLEKYCGVQLNNNYWINSSDKVTYWSNDTTGNVDTGAITGSDANVTLQAGDVINGTALTENDLKTLAQKGGASLSADGKTIVIGTGTEKTERSVVPEIGNKYTATTSQAQNITTGSNDWIVVATDYNDTITTGGADSIIAGAGSDKITVGADYASIVTGAGSDTVNISAEVQNVTIEDLNSSDLLTISGTFEAGTAKIEDTVLVVTDKTGTRQIRLGDLENAKSAKVNNTSTTIADWLTNAGIDLDNLQANAAGNTNSTEENVTGVVNSEDDGGRIDIDPDYKPSPIQETPPEQNQDQPHRSSNSTGDINVNLDNVTLTGGDYNVDDSKVGEISSEFPNISKYTKNGLTIYLAGTTTDTNGSPSNITSKTYEELTADQKTIVAGLFKWWAKEVLQLNEESYGISFDSDSAMVKEIGLYFYDSNGSGNTLAAVWNWSTSGTWQNTTKLMLNVNMNYYKSIADSDMEGMSTVKGAGFLDRTFAHEFTHAVMATNIHYFSKLPKFIKEGMAELTHGIDDERGNVIFQIAYDADWLDKSLDLSNTGTGSQTVGDGYAGGYMFLRYLARQASLQSLLDTDGNSHPFWKFDATTNTATYGTDSNTLFTLSGILKTDGITVADKVVTLTAANLDGETVTFSGDSGDYIFELSGISEPTTTDAGFDGFSYKSAGTSAGYTLSTDKKSVSYTAASDGETLFTLTNATITNDISVDTDKKTVTLTAANLNKKNVTVDGGYTLALDKDVPTSAQTKAAGFDGNSYKSATISDYYTASGSNITYTAASGGNTLFTLNNATITNAISVNTSKKIITLTAANLNKKNVTVDGGYQLALNSNVDTTKETVSKWATLKSGNVAYQAGGTGEYYSLNRIKTAVIYNATVAGTNKIEFSGIKGTPNLNGNSVELTANNFASNVKVISNAGGYNLALNGNFNNKSITATANDDTIKSNGSNLVISGGKGNDKITLGKNNTFLYAKGDGNDTLYNFDTNDKIKLTGTTKAKTSISGKDLIVTTDGGKIIVKNAAKNNVKIVDANDKVISSRECWQTLKLKHNRGK